jgi:hypothetical protein
VRSAATVANRVSAALLFVSIALAPLPFGSTDRAVIAGWCVILGVSLALASPRKLQSSQLIPLALLAAVFVAYGLALHEQVAQHPWSGIAPDPIWDAAARDLGISLTPVLSVVRDEALFAIGAPLCDMLAFAAGYVVCADRWRAHQLLQLIAWSGAC